ncbi:ABC transporter permease [Hydrotalea sp.]|uniref:ABC transporter permease n=1 Tax=Hydrotalea sp. TaxID=2881279 RepID=UPI003D136879
MAASIGKHIKNFGQLMLLHKSMSIGVVIISIAIFIAIFAYVLAPDSSTNANRIIPEIGSKPPGFSIQLLKLPLHKTKEETSGFINSLKFFFNGEPNRFNYIPITSYTTKNGQLYAQKYVGDGVEQPIEFPLNELPKQFITKTTFYLGTDTLGRDILSRLLIGTRISLAVGLIAVVISLTIGILLGLMAGYFGGKTDAAIMWLINVIWSIPTILLVFAVTLVLGKGFWQVFIAVGLTMWVNVARMVRGQTMAVKQLDYITAAKVLGYSNSRILLKHVLPNIAAPVMVIAANNFAGAIVIEAGLSFLGIGIQPPQPSWGLMMKENYNFIITHQPALALAPGIAIMLLVVGFNLLGNGLSDILNVPGSIRIGN